MQKKPELPKGLEFLNALSSNFYWCWDNDCVSLFRSIDPALWDQCEQNPLQLLDRVNPLRLWQKAEDPGFLTALDELKNRFENYLSQEPASANEISSSNPIAYFCAEYGIHNSLPIYSGGLGILAGDHLKSASDLNFPLVAIGLFYRYGYFRQKIAHDGWQEENYLDSMNNRLPLELLRDEAGEPIEIEVTMRGRGVKARAWKASVGRIPLYLLDTNIEDNDPIDRYITGHLYGGDSETRIVQEKLLGIGGVRLLRQLNIEPSVYHLNEGHSAFLTLELAREKIAESTELTFEEAASKIRSSCVFTTHTPVEAGNDTFDPTLIDECFEDEYFESLGLDLESFLRLGKTNPDDETEWFGMTPLAIRMCRSANGVSEKHGEVSRNLWHKMFPQKESATEVPITHITNGVHPSTWISPLLQDLFKKRIGENWVEVSRDKDRWSAAVDSLPDEELWKAHQTSKSLLVAFIRERTLRKNTGRENTINEHENTANLFDDDVLTIGFARRVAAYKRWNLLMTDIDRLLKMVDDRERPVQFVFAGKAHPQDRKAKAILQELMSINHESNWQNRAVFIEDYDQEVARYLVRGVDVWLNVPRRPLEASGTSGQKVAMNGGLNFSILDGWWLEGYNGKNGFAIGPESDPAGKTEDELDEMDAEALYAVLEETIIPKFYERDSRGISAEWLSAMKNSISTLTHEFSSDRMVSDYLRKIYAR